MILRSRNHHDPKGSAFPETFSFLVNCYTIYVGNHSCSHQVCKNPKEVEIPSHWDYSLEGVESFLNKIPTDVFYKMTRFERVDSRITYIYGYATVIALRESFLTGYLEKL